MAPALCRSNRPGATRLFLAAAALALLLQGAAASGPISLEQAAAGAQTLSELLYGDLSPGIQAEETPSNETEPGVVPHNRRMLQSGCSTTDSSAAAVLACTNAVRLNPSLLSDAECWNRVQAEVTSPARKALVSNAMLTKAAQVHNNLMISMNSMQHTLPGEADMGTRISATGYKWSALAENIAQGYPSAKAVVSGWFCSDGHRKNMFGCGYTDIGVASGSRFYTQDFGCPGGTCNSCSGSGSGGGGGSTIIDGVEFRPMHITANSFCMDVRNATSGNNIPVQQNTCIKAQNQKWRLVLSNGYYAVVDWLGRCLDISAGSLVTGTGSLVYSCNGGTSQQWSFEPTGQPSVYRLRNRKSSKCLRIRNASQVAGTQYVQWDCNSNLVDETFKLYKF